MPRNPFINAGALVIADILARDRAPEEAVQEIVGLCRQLADDDSIETDARVADSELRSGDRNRALAWFMRAEENLGCEVEHVLLVYVNHCSIAMSCRQLAMAGSTRAAGCLGEADARGITIERSRRILALMMTCGAYDESGELWRAQSRGLGRSRDR